MRTSLLLRREPFGKLLERTMSGYWSAETGTPVAVHWQDTMAGDQVWRGNIYLNFFCVSGAEKECFEVILREYGFSQSAWRRVMQSTYVRAAVTEPARSWLSQVRFGVSEAVPAAEEKLVIGGNHRIRIIQPRCGRSTVIHKCGFSRLAFEREIAARLGPASGLAPRFHGIEAGGRAFSEEYFSGTPANRLPSEVMRAVRATARIRLITEVHRPTLRIVRLGDRLQEIAEACARLSPVVGNEMLKLAQWASEKAGQSPVGLAISHGDFQDANILTDGQRLHVIDWEAMAERSQLYDLATFASGLRLAPDGLQAWKATVSRWVDASGDGLDLEVAPDGWGSLQAHAALWWMEESMLRLEEARMAEHMDDFASGDARIAAGCAQAAAHLKTI